jgi:hypothetical protein
MLVRLVAAVAFSAVLSVPAGAVAWIHKSVGAFSCYIPSSDWRVVGNNNGIDITSPTGDEDVSFAQTAWPAAVTTTAVASQVLNIFVRNGSLSNASVTSRGATSTIANGVTAQRVGFQGVHHWVNGTEPVVGYMIVTAFNLGLTHGYSVSLVFAPAAKAAADATTLEFMRGHITYYGKAP